jgi:hypothetical protein
MFNICVYIYICVYVYIYTNLYFINVCALPMGSLSLALSQHCLYCNKDFFFPSSSSHTIPLHAPELFEGRNRVLTLFPVP